MHLLAGPPTKKRKLNEISNDGTFLMNPETGGNLIQENQDLRARLAEAEGRLALVANSSGQLPGMI